MRRSGKSDSLLTLAINSFVHLGDSTFLPYCLGLKGNNLMTAGKYELAYKNYDEALSMCSQLLAKDLQIKIEIALCLQGLGEIQQQQYNYGEALKHFDEALEIEKELQEENPWLFGYPLLSIGEVHQSMGNKPSAIQFFKEALIYFQQLLLTLCEVSIRQEEQGYRRSICKANYQLAQVNYQYNNIDSALVFAQKSLAAAKLLKHAVLLENCNQLLATNSGEPEFALIPLLAEIPNADTSRIGMFGGSRGGMMTYMALTKTNRIKAAAVLAAPTDKFASILDRPSLENPLRNLVKGYEENKEEELTRRSAIKWVGQFPKNVPLLIMHGNADWRVKSSQSLRLALELDKHRVPYRLIIFEGADHGLSEFRSEFYETLEQWFGHYLKKGNVLPNMEYHGN